MKERFRKKVLPNGFTILFEKRDVPVVSVSLSLRGGGMNEKLNEKGISHYIEHMLYKGTKNRAAKQIAEEIEKNGGELNGFTAESVTSFWCKMPSRHLDVALNVLSDMVKNPLFDSVEMEKERKVIFEEIKMRKDSPRHYVLDKVQSLLYTGSLGLDLIGTEKTMNSITRKDLVKKFKELYTPNNLILTVVGECDFDYLVNWSKKNFGSKINKKIPERKFGMKNESVIETRGGIDQANVVFAYHSPLANDKEAYAEEVLITLMAGGISSRLFQEIREKRNLVYSIHGSIDSDRRYAHTVIYAGTKKENVEKVKNLLLDEFKKVSKNLTQKELDEIKDQLIGNHQISMEDSQSQMVHLLIHELDGDASEFYDFEEKISQVKLSEVKKLAAKVRPGNYSFFALVPK
jgi:predicted Zn-dependent peptidase